MTAPSSELQEALMARRVGEVVESSSTAFTSQCYRLEAAPALGALVRTASPGIYGVVSRVTTEPLDAARPVLARGETASSEEEVLQNNPQLSRLLTSRFQVLIAGYFEDGAVRQYLPPLPPRVHSFVFDCTPEETAAFTRSFDLLHLLLNSGEAHADEVAGAFLRRAAATHEDPAGFLGRACRTLAVELSSDVTRLNSILRRIAP